MTNKHLFEELRKNMNKELENMKNLIDESYLAIYDPTKTIESFAPQIIKCKKNLDEFSLGLTELQSLLTFKLNLYEKDINERYQKTTKLDFENKPIN